MNNDQIKAMYEKEGGPTLHTHRETDTGGTNIESVIPFLILIAGALVLVMVMS